MEPHGTPYFMIALGQSKKMERSIFLDGVLKRT